MLKNKTIGNCLIIKGTEKLIQTGSFTHNMCYRRTSPKRRSNARMRSKDDGDVGSNATCRRVKKWIGDGSGLNLNKTRGKK